MLKFYFHPGPNPMKTALLLAELGVPYETIPVDTLKGQQHEAWFRVINPNGKVPAIVDGDVTVFDSNAILLYLAEKHDKFLPTAPAARGKALSWLFFVATGLSPFSGQAVHFLHHAPEKLPYAQNRYLKEVQRHYKVLDDHLTTHKYLAGEEYSIADMALWGWANAAGYILGEGGLTPYPNLKRLQDEISARPAAARAHKVKDGLTLKAEFDDEARRHLFPSNQ